MEREELESILEPHRKWLYNDDGGIRANLRDADLRDADLRDADLRDANLRGANLRDADLRDANLRDADLRDADLRDADLRDADLRDAKNSDLALAKTCICPEKGSFIAFKKAHMLVSGYSCIVELEIPADAKRSNATGRKCRASKAKVISITNQDGSPLEDDVVVVSNHDSRFVYEVGKTVEPTRPFDEDRWNECAPGIHFFITREEAVNY